MSQHDNLQDKRDGIEMAVFFNEPAGRAQLKCFEDTMASYLIQLLDPKLDDHDALWIRAKAMGLVEVLNGMGVKIAASQDLPARRAARRTVSESVLGGVSY